MARIGVGDKYHLALNGVGYILRGLNYRKKDMKPFVPRFGTGEGQTDLDFWKVITQKDFSGGGFQDLFDDETKVAEVNKMIKNPFDGQLHPTPVSVGSTPGFASISGTEAWAEYNNNLYIAWNWYDSGVMKGGIQKWNGSAWANSKVDFATPVLDLCVFNNKLYATEGDNLWNFNGAVWASSVQAIDRMCVFNGKIYARGTGNNAGSLYSYDGTTKSWIGYVGDASNPINCFVVFNHRLYIGKSDGLYAFDGVQITCVLDYSKNRNSNNFRRMAVFNGKLYFLNANNIYAFNGSSVEKILDLANLQTITTMASVNGRLWFLTTAPSGVLVEGGKGQLIPADAYVLYFYDGQGVYLYDDTKTGLFTPYMIASFGDQLFYFSNGANAVQDNLGYLIDLSDEFKSEPVNDGTILTSFFDCNLPNVDKYFNSFEIDFEDIAVSDTITVYFRTEDGSSLTAWQSLGVITNATSNKLYLYNTTFSGVFKRIQFKIVVARTDASVLSICDYAFKYVISPDLKREWQMTVLCVGNSDNPLELLNGTAETKTPLQLREAIYSARQSDVPVGLEDVDYTLANGSILIGATTITVDSTDCFPSTGFLKIDDEIIYYAGKTATQFTGCVRGKLGTSASAHSDNSFVNMYFRVIVSEILNEEVFIPSEAPLSGTINIHETVVTLLAKEV